MSTPQGSKSQDGSQTIKKENLRPFEISPSDDFIEIKNVYGDDDNNC